MALKSIYSEFVMLPAPDEARRDFQRIFNHAFAAAGYDLEDHSEGRLTYVRRYHPGGRVVWMVLLFPIGLVLLAMEKKRLAMNLEFAPYGAGTLVSMTGLAAPKAAEELLEIAGKYNQAANEHNAAAGTPAATPSV
jgi:hypothetical protein